MEVEEIQTQGHKFRRISGGDGRVEQNKRRDEQYGDEEEDGEIKRRNNGGGGGVVVGGGIDFGSGGRLCGWPSSRIVRVSRASGGKDRHSKVLTSKGLRDRRVRLSVNTAIQFYDLQDRLGYDQPSKAVEWLLKAASSSISDLPPICTTFPDTNSIQLSEEKSLDSAQNQMELEIDPNCLPQQQQATMPKSACSSNSENSKGSGLSLSRPERRVKARERATAKERARVAEKDKDKEDESALVFQHDHLGQSLNPPISQNASSFTELLTSGMNGNVNQNSNNNNNQHSTTSPNGTVGEANFFNKPHRGHYSTPMDYFGSGLLGPASTRATHGFSGQLHLGNPLQQAIATASSPFFTFSGDPNNHHHHHHQELQQFSFVHQDHFIPVLATAVGNNGGNNNSNNNNSNEYNLNFTISSSSSSGLAGFSRGTLQSNSSSTPSLLPHAQRVPSIDGSSSTFFFGAAGQANTAIQPVENHHHLIPGFDARLQLCYGDGSSRHSDQKGKGKG